MPINAIQKAQLAASVAQIRAAISALQPDAAAPAPSPEPAPPPAPVPPGNSGLLDKLPHPMTAVSKPSRAGSYVDPQFGCKVVRISDVAQFGTSKVVKPAYGTIPAFNCDESKLILYVTQGNQTGHALFDGQTYAFIRMLDIDPADIEQFCWSTTDPDVIFYPYVHEQGNTHERHLVRYHVSTNAKDIAFNFGNIAPDVNFGSDPMFCSWDMDLWGFRNSSKGAFTLKLSTGVVSPFIKVTLDGTVQAAQVSPSGRYYIVGRNLYNAQTNALIRAMKIDTQEHGCMGQTADGQDVWCCVQFDSYEGTLVVENLETGIVTTIIGPSTGYPYPPSGTHISALAYKRKGWVAISIVGEAPGAGVLDQELLIVELATGKAYRLAHHRSTGAFDDYWSEPHVNLSPSGTRLVYASDWGGQSVDTYVVDLR